MPILLLELRHSPYSDWVTGANQIIRRVGVANTLNVGRRYLTYLFDAPLSEIPGGHFIPPSAGGTGPLVEIENPDV